MRVVTSIKGKSEIKQAFDEVLSIDPTVMFLFSAPSLLRNEDTAKEISQYAQGNTIIGCSSGGEISTQGVTDETIALLGIHFETGYVKQSSLLLGQAERSSVVGEAIANELKGDDLKAVFVLAPGTNVNGSELCEGIGRVLGKEVIVSGGLAADGTDFNVTHTLTGGEISTDKVVAVGLYGKNVIVSCGSAGGWRPFGPARRVTKSKGHILQELDGKPALQLYKQYLGENARNLPASGLSYPFAILRDDRTTSGLIRSALGIDHDHESLIMAGDVAEGARVCLMHADTGALIQGAAQASAEALRTHDGPEENGCALLVNCIGRRMVLGIDSDEEIEAVEDSFLPNTPFIGFFSYGEICSHTKTGKPELHNQTMTIAYITERVGEK